MVDIKGNGKDIKKNQTLIRVTKDEKLRRAGYHTKREGYGA